MMTQRIVTSLAGLALVMLCAAPAVRAQGQQDFSQVQIKTTLPFFAWLLATTEYLDGRFHTGYLDEVLAARNGRPFVQPTAEQEDLAAIAAVLHAMLSPAEPNGDGRPDAARRWKAQARAEGLRE